MSVAIICSFCAGAAICAAMNDCTSNSHHAGIPIAPDGACGKTPTMRERPRRASRLRSICGTLARSVLDAPRPCLRGWASVSRRHASSRSEAGRERELRTARR
jgi:hypothetical protein